MSACIKAGFATTSQHHPSTNNTLNLSTVFKVLETIVLFTSSKMYQKSLLFSLIATSAFAAVHGGSHGHLTKRYTFPLPDSKGSETFDEPKEITDVFDGGMKTYGRGVECTGQDEGGESDAVFIIKEGGTLKNAIIGFDQIEGVHCQGACTVENVWWEAVCEGMSILP